MGRVVVGTSHLKFHVVVLQTNSARKCEERATQVILFGNRPIICIIDL